MRKKKIIWIGLGLAALLIRVIFSYQPELAEQYYSRGLFLMIRWAIDYMIGWIPIPLIYFFILILSVWLFYSLRKFANMKAQWSYKLGYAALSVLSFLGGTLFFFFFMWGYNYARLPIEESLKLEVQPLQAKELRTELKWVSEKLVKLREELSVHYGEQPNELELPKQTEEKLRNSLEAWLDMRGFPTLGRVRGRWLYPKGIFLRFSSAGLYFPFTGEGHIDPGLHILDHPYTLAHELSHGYGFGDEGTCSFLSFIACTESGNSFFAYSAYLNYWMTLARNYRYYQPNDYAQVRDWLSEENKADIEAMYAELRKYPDIMPKFRNFAYDAYLKSQGIEEGMLNYNRVIMLVRAWRLAKKI
jgi:hypothetical protein